MNNHDRRVSTILNDLSYLEIVLSLDDLGRAVGSCQFEHGELGLISVRQGRVVRLGGTSQQQRDGQSALDAGKRRVTLSVRELSKCIPLSKIDYDDRLKTLRLNGIPVEMRVPK